MKRTVTFTAQQVTSLLVRHVTQNQDALAVNVDGLNRVDAFWRIESDANDNTISLTFSDKPTNGVKGVE